MSKRTKWALLIGVIIALAAIYFLSFTSVEIESSKGQWRAVFTKYNCHDSYWDGYLIYNGDKEVQNISTSLTYNGENITSTKGNLENNPGLTLREQILIGKRANKEVFYPITNCRRVRPTPGPIWKSCAGRALKDGIPMPPRSTGTACATSWT